MQTNGAVQKQHSNKVSAAAPKGVNSQDKKPSYDLQALKKQAGLRPFSDRVHLSEDGFTACPFHNGDSEKSFHVVQKDGEVFIGTCFSECGKSFDAIDFVKQYDKISTGEAIRKLVNLVSEHGEAPTTVLHKQPEAVPMTERLWDRSGRAVMRSSPKTGPREERENPAKWAV